MENEILILNDKKKNGILRILFSRIGLVAILILLQIFVLLIIYFWFSNHFEKFALAQFVFSVGMIFYLFNCGMDSTAKLTWLFLIMLFPVPATIMLWISQKDIGHNYTKKLVAKLINDSRDKIQQDTELLDRVASSVV